MSYGAGMTETAALTIPDLVGDAGRKEIVGNAIRELQVQGEHVKVQQVINGSSDDDQIPNMSMSYGTRLAQIRNGIERLAESNPEIVASIIADQQAKAAQE